MSNNIYIPTEEVAASRCYEIPYEGPSEGDINRGFGGETPTSFKLGNIPWSKGKKCPQLSESKKAYWDQWKLDNPGYKDKWKVNNRIKLGWNENSNNTASLNSTIIECPHCNKTGNVGNMKRWHFDQCKKK